MMTTLVKIICLLTERVAATVSSFLQTQPQLLSFLAQASFSCLNCFFIASTIFTILPKKYFYCFNVFSPQHLNNVLIDQLAQRIMISEMGSIFVVF